MRSNRLKKSIASLLIAFFLAMTTITVSAGEAVPSATDILDNAACIQCHKKQNSSLIKDWQNSAHATATPVVDCTSCHGKLHTDMASTARRDQTCTNCHGGEKAPVAHSYASSKHGTLMRIEKNTYDWHQPLSSANYRAPGCGYCHMHQNNHNVSRTVRHELMSNRENNPETEKVQDETRAVCQDCHSPRYITRLLDNGEAMLEIARKKVREAKAVIEQAENDFSEHQLKLAKALFQDMQQHLQNVHLGVGHQSPDYQWWHGQPALDGDLLRIKDSIGELQRLKNINAESNKP